MNDDRLQILLDKYRLGALSDEDRAELERTLLSSPQARQAFWDHARFHGLLARWGQEEWGRRMAEDPPSKPMAISPTPQTPRRWIRSRWIPWAAAAAACIALVLVLTLKRRPARPIVSIDPPAGLAGIAVVGASVEAKWADVASSLSAGTVLQAGVLKLESGAAQIEFFSGARLIIQGPAELRLVSEMEAFCQRGRLSAYVPGPARGFKLATPDVTVVDLGTEFAVSVPPAGAPEVHVFSGTVELSRPTAPATIVNVTAGEAIRVEVDSIRPMKADRRGFLDELELARLASRDSQRRKEAWQSSAANLSRDPATLMHFTFPDQSDWSRTVVNRAAGSPLAMHTGSMVGCGWADGRWPGSRAIEFNGPGDRFRFDVPGQLDQVTLLAWVRIDALPNAAHALLTPDGLTPGTLRWELSRRGELRLGIARASGKPEPNWEVVISPEVITADRVGQWVMLATTFDGRSVRHFADGRIVKTGQAYSPAPLVIGPAEVGNWRGETPRFLQGRLDELAILSRALTPLEIQAIHEAGVSR